MAGINGNDGNATHQVARAIMLEAAERVLGKEHSRDDVMPGSFAFDFVLTGRVEGREIEPVAFGGTLTVNSDGVATPTTPYKDLAAFVLSKANDATRNACLAAIAAGDFTADPAIVAAFDNACKQYREMAKAANPQRKRGDVRPVYQAVEAPVVSVRKPRKAG